MQAISNIFQKTLRSGYVALACCLAAFTLYLCYAIEWRGPFRDLWEFIGIIQDELNGHWDIHALIQPYGGIHRILLPKLLFYLDYRFAQGSNFLALSVTIALHLGACTLFIHRILEDKQNSREDFQLLLATTLLFFFSTTQIYNLIYISDNQVVIANSLAVFAVWVFCIYLQKQQSRLLYLSNALVVLACLSHSSGLMLLPAMIVILFITRQAQKDFVAQVVITAIASGLYISGNHSLGSPFSLLINLKEILRYTGIHLSSPTSRQYPQTGIMIAYLSMLYIAAVCYRVRNKFWQPGITGLFCITLCIHGILIAFITAYGRQIYPNSATTDRYQTLVMTYWAALMILVYYDLKKNKAGLACLAPALSLILLLPYQYKNAEEMAWLSSRVTIAHTAVIVGITDMDTVAATLSHPLLMDKNNLVEKHNNFFRQQHLAYFSDDVAKYFLVENADKPFPETIDSSATCRSELFSIEKLAIPGEQDFRFSGRGDTGKTPLETVLVMDSQQKIIGLARNHRLKGEFLPLAFRNPEEQQWIGFIHSEEKINFPLIFLGKTANGYCRLFTKTTLEM